MTNSGRFNVGRLEAAPDAAALAAEYDRIAESYDTVLLDEHQWRTPEIIAALLAWLLPRDARILDAACGTGLVGVHLRRFNFTQVHGLDMSEGMLASAARKQSYSAFTKAALGAPLPFSSGAFDAVTASGAFTPNHAPPESLDELVRVTRPGGLIVFSLRSDLPPPGFDEAIARLTRSGRWTLFRKGAEFQSMPRAEPSVLSRIWVFEVAAGR